MTKQLLALLSSILIFTSFKSNDNGNCPLKWVWLDQASEVGLLDKPNGKIVKRIKNNYEEERIIMFEILEAEDKWLKVKTIESPEQTIGWILASKTAAHTRNYK